MIITVIKWIWEWKLWYVVDEKETQVKKNELDIENETLVWWMKRNISKRKNELDIENENFGRWKGNISKKNIEPAKQKSDAKKKAYRQVKWNKFWIKQRKFRG